MSYFFMGGSFFEHRPSLYMTSGGLDVCFGHTQQQYCCNNLPLEGEDFTSLPPFFDHEEVIMKEVLDAILAYEQARKAIEDQIEALVLIVVITIVAVATLVVK